MMKPQLLFGSVMAVVAGFSVFEVATALAGLPSPLYAGHTIVAHLYDYAFIRFEMSYAATVAVILFLWTFGLGRLLMRIFSSKNEY
jgi:multiple sugar transport system permease protein